MGSRKEIRLGDKGETRGAQVKENSKEKKQERRREWNNMVGTKSTPRKKKQIYRTRYPRREVKQ